MSEVQAPEKSKPTVRVNVKFLPFMCENAPAFDDIDKALALMPRGGVQHRQREIWKMAPKKDDKGNVERDSDGHMKMVKVVTRTSKVVMVKSENGLCSFTSNGAVEPMDFTDVREIIALLEK